MGWYQRRVHGRRSNRGKKKKKKQQQGNNGCATPIFFPRKLKHLAKEKLDRDIQVEGRPHNAYEDALAALDLYRSVRSSWEKMVSKTLRQQQQKQLFYQGNNVDCMKNIHLNPNNNVQEQLDQYYQQQVQPIYYY